MWLRIWKWAADCEIGVVDVGSDFHMKISESSCWGFNYFLHCFKIGKFFFLVWLIVNKLHFFYYFLFLKFMNPTFSLTNSKQTTSSSLFMRVTVCLQAILIRCLISEHIAESFPQQKFPIFCDSAKSHRHKKVFRKISFPLSQRLSNKGKKSLVVFWFRGIKRWVHLWGDFCTSYLLSVQNSSIFVYSRKRVCNA